MAVAGEDELFEPPGQVPSSAPPAVPPPPRSVATDARFAGRIVGSMLVATGAPTQDDLALASGALVDLGRSALVEADLVAATPEALAPRLPIELRIGVLEVLYTLAGDEPIRRRLADAYAGLWGGVAEPPPPKRRGSKLMRWMIGKLPQHAQQQQREETQMVQPTPYRGGDAAVQVEIVDQSPLRRQVERIRDEYAQVVAAVEQVIVGKRDVIERVLVAMAARGHVLLVDIPGVGKTQLCKAIAAAIETRFGRIQFTPDLLPMDVTGANVFDVRDKQFHFRPGPIFTHILLADEINRATPKTQSALLEVMEERSVTVDGVTYRVEEPFQVLATMNPLDHQGTYALPAAQIDRFMMMLEVGLPSPADEVKVLDYHLAAISPLASVEPVVSRSAFITWRDTVPYIHVSPGIKRAAVDAITALRKTTGDGHSISPRATIAWVRAAQAKAMVSGREFVTAEDLLAVGPDVLRHRLSMDAATVRERIRAAIAAGVR
jgi:MoxR-like ATPase